MVKILNCICTFESASAETSQLSLILCRPRCDHCKSQYNVYLYLYETSKNMFLSKIVEDKSSSYMLQCVIAAATPSWFAQIFNQYVVCTVCSEREEPICGKARVSNVLVGRQSDDNHGFVSELTHTQSIFVKNSQKTRVEFI